MVIRLGEDRRCGSGQSHIAHSILILPGSQLGRATRSVWGYAKSTEGIVPAISLMGKGQSESWESKGNGPVPKSDNSVTDSSLGN